MTIFKKRSARLSASRVEKLQVDRLGRTRRRRRQAAAAVLVLVGAAVVVSVGAQTDVQHGLGFTKGCTSPVAIGDPYSCSYAIRNVLDEAEDTHTINSIVDTVHAASGDVTSADFFNTAQLDNGGTAATCTGGAITGTGTALDPWIGADSCTLPFGSRINVHSFSHYTVQAGDFGLPGHNLTDIATLGFNDECDDPAGTNNENCSTEDATTEATGTALIVKLASTTTTTIHDEGHQAVTTVEAGTTVHDFVDVEGVPNKPVPTGNVNIDWFTNGTCTGDPETNSGQLGPLDASGDFDATTFTFTPPAGQFGFLAHYEGDDTYAASDGICEPLTVVDANIQISPLTATNPVNTNHTLTGHVNVNDGTGFANAPEDTQIDFSITSGPGSFVGNDFCLTILATGSCTVDITSATPGTTTIQATTTVTVGGLSLTRTTGDGLPGDSEDATKDWADAVVTTQVHDASHTDITNTTVPSGTIVHDEATVAKAVGTPDSVPDPTGDVTFTLYDNGTCDGNVVQTDANQPLVAGVAESTTYATPTAGNFSYLAHYNGDENYPESDGPCEPFSVSTPAAANFSPGFWKTHQAETSALLPQTLGNHVVSTYAEAKTILSGMGCGANGRLNCMAGMLLAAQLNLENGGNTCIQPVVDQANALLIKYSYDGRHAYTLTAADSALAQQLHDKLSAYNVHGVTICT